MTPSVYHEGDKTRLGRLIEAWAEEADVLLEGFGSWALKAEATQHFLSWPITAVTALYPAALCRG
jgi:hypothetical protein